MVNQRARRDMRGRFFHDPAKSTKYHGIANQWISHRKQKLAAVTDRPFCTFFRKQPQGAAPIHHFRHIRHFRHFRHFGRSRLRPTLAGPPGTLRKFIIFLNFTTFERNLSSCTADAPPAFVFYRNPTITPPTTPQNEELMLF